MFRTISVLVLVTALSAPASALTIAPLTFEQLVEAATAVIYARVSGVQGRWTADRRSIESLVTLQPLRYLKGNLGDGVIMRLPGGEAGGLLHVLPGAPVLRAGDLAVIFLEWRGPSIPIPVGLTQGVFRVLVDSQTGRAVVTSPPLKASAVGRVIRGAAERRALTVDRFAEQVRAITESHQ
ncbi:MAG TPA: hypothetical protein VEK56_05915 [Vicinamibacterales bacterium]|nr:hypothetical protein [Vicinamibacterales bacterium]